MRLILFILSGMLFLVSVARAEITYMNCKFNEGWHEKGAKREDVKKMPDLSISLDKEKRIIKVTDRNFEPYNVFKDSMHCRINGQVGKMITRSIQSMGI